MSNTDFKVVIISSSVREGRKSHRVALYLKNELETQYNCSAHILDLKEYDFPVFHERLKYQKNPLPSAIEFGNTVKHADGVIIVTPEYNGGYPAALKNVVDLLTDEWRKKPVAISTVSDGVFGGAQVLTSIQYVLWKIKAWTVTAQFPNPQVDKNLSETGIPTDSETMQKRSSPFIKELLWTMEASRKMAQS